jgi:DNA end-binding protein Ku
VLLLRAMTETGMAAIGKFVLWGKENLCLIRALGDTLALELLYYAEDVRPHAEIDEAVAATEVKAPELAMARQLVDSLVGSFDPDEYANEYRGELKTMLDAKVAGREIAEPEPVAPAPVIDLMDALKKSLAAAQGEPATAKPAPRKRKARAKS